MTLGFGFKSYVNYQLRQRKQRDVSKENLFFVKLLQDALPVEDPPAALDESSASSIAAISSSGVSDVAGIFGADSTTRDQQQLVPVQHSASLQLASQHQPQHSINSSHQNHSNTHPKHAQSSQSSKTGSSTPTSSPPANGSANHYSHSNGSVGAATNTNGQPHHRPNRRSCDKGGGGGDTSSAKPYLQTTTAVLQAPSPNAKTSSTATSNKETNGKLTNHHQSANDVSSAIGRDKESPPQSNGRNFKSTSNDTLYQQASPITEGSAIAKRQSSTSMESNDRGLCEIGGGPTDKESKSAPASLTCKSTLQNGGGGSSVASDASTTAEAPDSVVAAVEKAPKSVLHNSLIILKLYYIVCLFFLICYESGARKNRSKQQSQQNKSISSNHVSETSPSTSSSKDNHPSHTNTNKHQHNNSTSSSSVASAESPVVVCESCALLDAEIKRCRIETSQMKQLENEVRQKSESCATAKAATLAKARDCEALEKK